MISNQNEDLRHMFSQLEEEAEQRATETQLLQQVVPVVPIVPIVPRVPAVKLPGGDCCAGAGAGCSTARGS